MGSPVGHPQLLRLNSALRLLEASPRADDATAEPLGPHRLGRGLSSSSIASANGLVRAGSRRAELVLEGGSMVEGEDPGSAVPPVANIRRTKSYRTPPVSGSSRPVLERKGSGVGLARAATRRAAAKGGSGVVEVEGWVELDGQQGLGLPDTAGFMEAGGGRGGGGSQVFQSPTLSGEQFVTNGPRLQRGASQRSMAERLEQGGEPQTLEEVRLRQTRSVLRLMQDAPTLQRFLSM